MVRLLRMQFQLTRPTASLWIPWESVPGVKVGVSVVEGLQWKGRSERIVCLGLG